MFISLHGHFEMLQLLPGTACGTWVIAVCTVRIEDIVDIARLPVYIVEAEVSVRG